MHLVQFEVGGHQYQSARMSLFDQNIVARRMSGVLMWFAQARAAVAKANAELELKEEQQMPPPSDEGFAQALVGMSSDMSEADINAAYRICLRGVQRRVEDKGWQKLMAGDLPIFEDVDLMAMQKIVYKVLEGNGIIDFFSAGSKPPSGSSAPGSSTGSTGSGFQTERTG